MTNQECDHDLSPNPLDELEEESGEGHAHLQNIATLDPAALRDTNKLAILNVQTTVRLALNQFRPRWQCVFNWPATGAVYAANARKVKNNSGRNPWQLCDSIAGQHPQLIRPRI